MSRHVTEGGADGAGGRRTCTLHVSHVTGTTLSHTEPHHIRIVLRSRCIVARECRGAFTASTSRHRTQTAGAHAFNCIKMALCRSPNAHTRHRT
eukprot:7234087-Prymnesium_polylepis.1